MKLVKCEYCGNEFSTKGIGSHIWRMHGDGVNFKPTLGKPGWSKGLTKETSESVKKMSESLKRPKSDLELELDDDNKLKTKWINKRVNAKKENIEFKLTYDEYCTLVKEAGLKSSQLGFSGDGYVLARYNDDGPYAYDNCRFILQSENAKEKKISARMIASSKRNLIKMNEHNKLISKEERSNQIKTGQRNSKKYQDMLAKKHEQHLLYLENKRKSVVGSSNVQRHSGIYNSQYSTFWITDGYTNMKWKNDLGQIPEGYHKGRTCN